MPRKRKQKTEAAIIMEPKPRAFTPDPCANCITTANGKNFVRTTHTIRTTSTITRYCVCENCGNRFKQVELLRP